MKKTTIAFVLIFLLSQGNPVHSQEREGDFDGDGKVGFLDFVEFAVGFDKAEGDPGFDARLDLDASGKVDFFDFIRFTEAFAQDNPPPEPDPVRILLYIADLVGNKVDVLDTETNLLDPARQILVSQPRGLAFSSQNGRVYIASVDTFHAVFQSGSIDYSIPLLDPPAEPGGNPVSRAGYKVALSQDHKFAYITEEVAGQVEVIDLTSAQSVTQIPVGPTPVGIVASSDGQEIYVGHAGSSISVIDGVQHVFKDSIAVGEVATRRLAISPDGSRIYSATRGASGIQLIAVDPIARAVVDSLIVGEPTDLDVSVSDLAVSEETGFLHATIQRLAPLPSDLVTFQFVGELLIVDGESFQEIGNVEIGEIVANLGVTPDGRTAYVGAVESVVLDPIQQVFIVDLENREKIGSLRGFELPADLKPRAEKPAFPLMDFLEIILF